MRLKETDNSCVEAIKCDVCKHLSTTRRRIGTTRLPREWVRIPAPPFLDPDAPGGACVCPGCSLKVGRALVTVLQELLLTRQKWEEK